MAEQATKEPTMEEILSSIRRIISEDGKPVGEASGGDALASSAEDDFIGLGEDLAEAANEEFDVSDGEHLLSVDELLDSGSEFEEFEALAQVDDVAETDFGVADTPLEEAFEPTELDQSVAEIEASVFDVAEPTAPSTHAEAEAAIAEVAAAAGVSAAVSTPEPIVAETSIEKAPQMTETPPTAAITAPAATSATGNAIENMVAEMMRPMIKEWIDTNLPGIVERKVEAEIQQVANKVVAALRND